LSRSHFFRLLAALGVLILLVPCLAQKDAQTAAAWLTTLTDAVNRKDRAAIARVARIPANQVPAWVFETTTPQWKGTVLSAPDGSTQWVAFSAWHTLESDGDHLHPLVSTPEGLRLGAEVEKEIEPGSLSIVHHDLTVRFRIPQKTALITDQVRFHEEDNPEPFSIVRLSNDFKVREVRRENAQGEAVAFRQTGGFVLFETPKQPDFTLYFAYDGVVNHRGSDYIADSEATLNSYWYPHIARQPSTATVAITTPRPTWTAVGIGELENDTENTDGTHTLTFRNEVPVCFYTVTAGRYFITTRTVGNRKLMTYLRDDTPATAQNCLNQLEKCLPFFEQEFGAFPYSRYAIVELRGAFGGALESYSFATFGPGMLPGVIVHEVAHTWWGGLVNCAYTRSMWNESFAEYSDALFQRKGQKPQIPTVSRTRDLQRNAAVYNAFSMANAHDTSDFRQSSVGYDKGGRVLRVLEEEIGRDKMRASVQAFLKENARGKAVEWNAFEKAVNKTTGADYRWFFAQWMERRGMPALSLQNVRTVKVNNGYVVAGEIVQSGAPYRLTLPLRGTTTDGKAVDETLVVSKDRTAFRLQSLTPFARVTLDPYRVLPLAAPPNTPGDADPTVWQNRR
jgi:aminopeptidase N